MQHSHQCANMLSAVFCAWLWWVAFLCHGEVKPLSIEAALVALVCAAAATHVCMFVCVQIMPM
jgi:hypothetical protein